MDNLHAGERYEETPESTRTLSNDSGYITATPSTLCNDSPDNASISDLSTRWTLVHDIRETPQTSQKSVKLSSLRKHLLRENCRSCELENVNEHSEDSLCCSCASVVDEREDSVFTSTNDRNETLAESFNHLLVDESVCESKTITEVCSSREEKAVLRSKSETKLFVNSKKKSGIFLGKVAAKKFKQDIGAATGRSEGTGSPRQCDYSGVSRLDILVHLGGGSGCFPTLISQILSYLPSQDLVTVCLVSPEWRKICVDDPVANRRRLAHVRHVKHAKENIAWETFKQVGHSLNLSLASNKGVFREIQNTERRVSNSSTPPSTPRSPPVSPSKVRFKLFFKAGIALDEGTRLIRCPRCSHPSQATSNHARCQAVGCQYNFCVSCLCDIHEGLPCPGHSILPVRRKISCIGSKESRRNLRRL